MNTIFSTIFVLAMAYNSNMAVASPTVFKFSGQRNGNNIEFPKCADGSVALSGCSSSYCVYQRVSGNRNEYNEFKEITPLSIKKCNEISLIDAKMQNDKDLPKCEDGSSSLSGCASEYCIVLVPGIIVPGKGYAETNFVKIERLLTSSMMTNTGSECEQDLCVAKCEKLSLIAAKTMSKRSPLLPADDMDGGYPKGKRSVHLPVDAVDGGYPKGKRSAHFPADPMDGGYPKGKRSVYLPVDAVDGGYPKGKRSARLPADAIDGGYPKGKRSAHLPADDMDGGYPKGK